MEGGYGASALKAMRRRVRDNKIDDTVLPSPTTEVALGRALLSG